MSEKNKTYTVHAYRWGNREDHSYTIGVFSKKQKAIDAANVEEEWRGGKYICEVIEWDIDQGMQGREYEPKIIKHLERR